MGHPLLKVLSKEPDGPDDLDEATRARLAARKPCPGLWKTPVIRWDGQLMACCADVGGEIPLGNLHDADFEELWDGPLMTQYRLWHIEGAFWKMPKCLNCGGINYHKFDDQEVEAFLERKGHAELWPVYAARLRVES